MVLVGWNRLIERRYRRVDQEMMVPGIGNINACRRNTHMSKTEPDTKGLAATGIDNLAVIRPTDIKDRLLQAQAYRRIARARPGT